MDQGLHSTANFWAMCAGVCGTSRDPAIPAMAGAKVGRAEAWGILVDATGDASISAAMANGGIKRIHHVDRETTNILGIYAKYVTIVHGE